MKVMLQKYHKAKRSVGPPPPSMVEKQISQRLNKGGKKAGGE